MRCRPKRLSEAQADAEAGDGVGDLAAVGAQHVVVVLHAGTGTELLMPSRWSAADDTGTRLRDRLRGRHGTVMGTTMEGATGVAAACPRAGRRTRPGCRRAATGGSSAHAAPRAAAGTRGHRDQQGRMGSFFIGVLSRGAPGAPVSHASSGCVTHRRRADNGSLALVLNKPRHP